MRHIYILFLILSVVLIGCKPKTVTLKFDGTNYYQIVQGSTVAYDGTNWFQQRQQEQSFGEANGVALGQGELWIKLTGEEAGSHISQWHRDLATSNNTNIPPVFQQN